MKNPSTAKADPAEAMATTAAAVGAGTGAGAGGGGHHPAVHPSPRERGNLRSEQQERPGM